jgi:hypothetical protein
VVEVEDEEHHSEAGGQLGEGSQQSHGIGAAADGYADALAWTDEAMLAQMMFERLKHRNIITEARVRGFGSVPQNGSPAGHGLNEFKQQQLPKRWRRSSPPRICHERHDADLGHHR